ncbi:MAG: hypothetical protein L0H73_18690, partial [Nitrococcus sp.]|nr:hypothetical protein [Nitrococcus sp.]
AADDWGNPTKLLVIMAVVAAAHHDAVASADGIELFATPLLTSNEIASARAALTANGQVRAVSGGWQLTTRARKQVRHLQEAPAAAS